MKEIIRLIYVLLILTGFLVFPASAQEDVKIKKSKFKKDAEGFKEAWKAVNKGNDFYSQGKGLYRDAREQYLKAWNYNSNNPELNYKIGVCYLFTDDKFQSINYLRMAFQLKPKVAKDIHLLLGRAFHQILSFDSAVSEYKLYMQNLPRKELREVTAKIDKYVLECENGKQLVAEPLRVIISNAGTSINSSFDDYNSLFDAGDSIMYFTSRRPEDEDSKRNPYDNKYFEDIFYSVRKDKNWAPAKILEKPINTKHNDAAVTLVPGDTKMVIYRGNKDGGDLYESELRGQKQKWTRPLKVSSKLLSKYRETSLCFSPDSIFCYFVSNDPKKSYGGKDIYVCETRKKGSGRWKKPVNMGSQINTPFDEEAVQISKDGKTLYFSSKGHNSMGGYDVFYTLQDENGSWAVPENLGYPINTPDDELFYKPDPVNEKIAWYTSIRERGIGGFDIYKIAFLGEEKELITLSDTQVFAWKQQFPPSIFFRNPELVQIDSTYVLQGKVTDLKSGMGLVSKIELIDVAKSMTVGTAVSDTGGNYKFNIPGKLKFGIEITAKDYLFFLDVFDLSGDPSDLVITRNFALAKVELGTKVVLKNIFFETGKATLKTESFPELENVLKFLQDNSGVKLEISGHTDNVGSRTVNQKLSENRAKAVVDWLVSKGIDKSRLESKGYADSQPVAGNDTPDGRSQNRRVEFKVTGI